MAVWAIWTQALLLFSWDTKHPPSRSSLMVPCSGFPRFATVCAGALLRWQLVQKMHPVEPNDRDGHTCKLQQSTSPCHMLPHGWIKEFCMGMEAPALHGMKLSVKQEERGHTMPASLCLQVAFKGWGLFLCLPPSFSVSIWSWRWKPGLSPIQRPGLRSMPSLDRVWKSWRRTVWWWW